MRSGICAGVRQRAGYVYKGGRWISARRPLKVGPFKPSMTARSFHEDFFYFFSERIPRKRESQAAGAACARSKDKEECLLEGPTNSMARAERATGRSLRMSPGTRAGPAHQGP